MSANNNTGRKIRAPHLGRWLRGQWLVKHVPFVVFIAVLGVLYIANGHMADNTIRNIGKAEYTLKQLQYQYKTIQAEVIFRSKESEMVKAVAPLGVKRLTEPPVLLKPENSKTDN
jgi:hypothetical protein